MNKALLILYLGAFALNSVCAAEQRDTGGSAKTEEIEKQKKDEQDALFNGIKVQNGNTTIVQGEQIATDPSVFHTGQWTPEELSLFRRHVVSSANANGTISYSESRTTDSFLKHHSQEKNDTTDLNSDVTVSTRGQ